MDKDIIPFSQINQDPRVMEHFPSLIFMEETQKQIEILRSHFEDHGFTFFATDELSSNKFIGFIGMKHVGFHSSFTPAVEIGWRLSYDTWGYGYATEGAKKVLENRSVWGIDKVHSFTTTTNWRSENVMKKIGMKKVGQFEHPNVEAGQLKTHVLYETV